MTAGTEIDELVRRMQMRDELDRAKALEVAARDELARIGRRSIERATWLGRLADAIRTQTQVRRQMREQYTVTA